MSVQAKIDFGFDFRAANSALEDASAEARLEWLFEKFGERTIVTTSFGAQAAVTLSLATRVWSDIPVVFLDTGYLFPETYRFADELTERLGLNLKVYRAEVSAAWQEARHGQRWLHGKEGIEAYNLENKVEPMARALDELDPRAWIAGLRRDQAKERSRLRVLEVSSGRIKAHPIIDWTDRDVYGYLTAHELPYHPLWGEGYLSIGDVHTTRKLTEGVSADQLRFFGVKRECGLHEDIDADYEI